VQSSRLAVAAKDLMMLMMMMMMTPQQQASTVAGFISFYAYESPYCNCCFHDSNFHCTKHKKKHKAQGTRQKQPLPTPSLADKIQRLDDPQILILAQILPSFPLVSNFFFNKFSSNTHNRQTVTGASSGILSFLVFFSCKKKENTNLESIKRDFVFYT